MPKKATKAGARRGASRDALDSYGLENVCGGIMDGKSLTMIAKDAKSSLTRLLVWIDSDAERSARVREARQAMAKVWDEKAEEGISKAADEFELKKAKEIAHHYRWRASKVAPREYGDKVAIGGADDLPPVRASIDASKLSDAALKELLSARAATDGG